MSALEQEIVDRFDQLDKDGKQRMLRLLNERVETFDWDAWFSRVDKLRETMHQERGDAPFVDATTMLRQMRNGEDE